MNVASGHIGFGKYGGPKEHQLRRPQKNEFRIFWSTSMPNFMLVDKSAQSSPLRPGLMSILILQFKALPLERFDLMSYNLSFLLMP